MPVSYTNVYTDQHQLLSKSSSIKKDSQEDMILDQAQEVTVKLHAEEPPLVEMFYPKRWAKLE